MTPILQSSLEEAKQEGIAQGWQKGQQEGWQKGQQEGQKQERKQVVLNMLRSRFETPVIAKMTGLSEEEINKLKNGS